MKYFFDNCISYRYVNVLKALDVDAVALRDVYAPNIEDTELFKNLRGSDQVFITSDTSQTTREHEARGLLESGVTALFFGPFWGKMIMWQQAIWLITRWQMIDGFAKGAAKGTCAEIQQNGKARVFPK